MYLSSRDKGPSAHCAFKQSLCHRGGSLRPCSEKNALFQTAGDSHTEGTAPAYRISFDYRRGSGRIRSPESRRLAAWSQTRRQKRANRVPQTAAKMAQIARRLERLRGGVKKGLHLLAPGGLNTVIKFLLLPLKQKLLSH